NQQQSQEAAAQQDAFKAQIAQADGRVKKEGEAIAALRRELQQANDRASNFEQQNQKQLQEATVQQEALKAQIAQADGRVKKEGEAIAALRQELQHANDRASQLEQQNQKQLQEATVQQEALKAQIAQADGRVKQE